MREKIQGAHRSTCHDGGWELVIILHVTQIQLVGPLCTPGDASFFKHVSQKSKNIAQHIPTSSMLHLNIKQIKVTKSVLSVTKSSEGRAVTWHCAPAVRTKSVFPVARTNSAQPLLLPSGMHTKKLERYREDQHGPCTRMTRCFRVVDLRVSIFILFFLSQLPTGGRSAFCNLENVTNFPFNISNFSSIFLYYLREVFTVSQ